MLVQVGDPVPIGQTVTTTDTDAETLWIDIPPEEGICGAERRTGGMTG